MSRIRLTDVAIPATPPAAQGYLFASLADKELYWKKDDGTTTALGGGASTSLISSKTTVRAATTTTLPSNTYSAGILTATANGALSAQDGVTLVANDRLLVKNEAAGANNGIYVVTQVGDGSNPYILTRATDNDSSAKMVPNTNCFISEGSTLADTLWFLSTNNPITLGTTALTFVQFAAPNFALTSSSYANQGTTTTVLHGNAAGNLSFGSVSLTADITGTLAIGNGGTGQTTKTAAFDALSPTTTKGDVIVNNGTNNIRLGVGTDGFVLSADSTQASGLNWVAQTGGGGGSMNIGLALDLPNIPVFL